MMKTKFCFLFLVGLIFLQTACYSSDKHQLRLSKTDFYIDTEYCFSLENDKEKLINCLGQPDYIDEVFTGYIYFYTNYNLCIEVNFENKISFIYYYFINYPIKQGNFIIEKMIINELEFYRDSELSVIKEYLDKNNIQYSLKDHKTYLDMTVNSANKKYYFRFSKNDNRFILERIQY